ncbi:tRNA-specific adenosine-34 deaminase [hydrothermal vent metagenome]|uniref:tRNA-specific adenosine-34 deaminase n=1 Tax=hydrothermal vent metagenome TaxID=652676 RepID=A0A1W1CKQ9_9ZZZZ
MRLAIKEAEKGIAQNEGGPFGAVIVKDNKVIAKTHNTVLKSQCAINHAEINAIKKASKKLCTFNLSGCELYTTCMPCPMCMGAIEWANITTIYYGSTSEDADSIGFRDAKLYKSNSINLINIERDKTLKLFTIWEKKEDKIIY